MRTLAASVVAGLVILSGPLTASGQPAPPATRTQVAAESNATGDKDTYLQNARLRVRDWDIKLHDFATDANARAHEAGSEARADLNLAWTKVGEEEHKLSVAASEDWDSARNSFEKADRELAAAWDRVRAQTK